MTESDRKQHDHFLRLFMGKEQALRVFVRSLLFSQEEEREVMQEVAVVLWRKFDSAMDEISFTRWAFGVARMEALTFRRDRARDRHSLGDEVFELLSQVTVDHAEGRRKWGQTPLLLDPLMLWDVTASPSPSWSLSGTRSTV